MSKDDGQVFAEVSQRNDDPVSPIVKPSLLSRIAGLAVVSKRGISKPKAIVAAALTAMGVWSAAEPRSFATANIEVTGIAAEVGTLGLIHADTIIQPLEKAADVLGPYGSAAATDVILSGFVSGVAKVSGDVRNGKGRRALPRGRRALGPGGDIDVDVRLLPLADLSSPNNIPLGVTEKCASIGFHIKTHAQISDLKIKVALRTQGSTGPWSEFEFTPPNFYERNWMGELAPADVRELLDAQQSKTVLPAENEELVAWVSAEKIGCSYTDFLGRAVVVDYRTSQVSIDGEVVNVIPATDQGQIGLA